MHRPEEIVLDIRHLSLSFQRNLSFNNSLRDLFVNCFKISKHPDKQESFNVLDNISFSLHRGERLGLLAKNGTGKSTLCRCISGRYEPTRGTISYHGQLRVLFESSLAFYPELSGRENMKILAEIFYSSYYNAAEISKIIEESIAFSELHKLIDAPLKSYSKGMLLRLSMSVLSARPADLLILDEVFDGADEFFRAKLTARIKNLIEESGAVILVSHYENQILEVCNRVLVMKDGHIIFDGSPQEAFEVYRQSEK